MPINIFGFKLFSEKEMASMQDNTPRPGAGWGGSDFKNIEQTFESVAIPQLYDYAYASDTYRTILNAKERETFRNGADWKPKFVRKCRICRTQYKNEVDNCTECGSTELVEPDKQQQQILAPFLEKANANNQPLLEVLSSQDQDFQILDNGYLLFLKKYFFDEEGKIKSTEPLEIIRGDPIFLRKIIDRYGRHGYDYHSGKPVYICPEHRHSPQNGTKCAHCGKQLYLAHFKTHLTDKTTYYLAGEVIHKTMYSNTIFYGYPMALTVLTKIRTLFAMDNWVLKYYVGGKSPKGMPVIRTTNVDAANKAWDKWLDQTKANPNSVFPFFAPSNPNDSGDVIQYIDFTRTLEEMQYTEAKNDIVVKIGAPFGVCPIFQNDISTGGGLNNEGLQITVTTRGTESSQKTYNDELDFITAQLGITDWNYRLNPPEEKDLMAEKQKEAQDISNAQIMQSMGFEVTRTPEGEFRYSSAPTKPKEESPLAILPEQTKQELNRNEGEPTE